MAPDSIANVFSVAAKNKFEVNKRHSPLLTVNHFFSSKILKSQLFLILFYQNFDESDEAERLTVISLGTSSTSCLKMLAKERFL